MLQCTLQSDIPPGSQFLEEEDDEDSVTEVDEDGAPMEKVPKKEKGKYTFLDHFNSDWYL